MWFDTSVYQSTVKTEVRIETCKYTFRSISFSNHLGASNKKFKTNVIRIGQRFDHTTPNLILQAFGRPRPRFRFYKNSLVSHN